MLPMGIPTLMPPMTNMPSSCKAQNVFWTEWKALWAAKNFAPQYSEDNMFYVLWGYDGPEAYTCTISKQTVPDMWLNTGLYTQNQNDADKVEFLALASEFNKPIVPLDANKRPVVISSPRAGSEVIYTTHNFCDPCTWYGDSERVTDEVLVDSGDGLTFMSANDYWIDMVSGRIQDDDGIADEQRAVSGGGQHGYQVVITIDGITKTMREPFESTGGDFTIDFKAGTVTFFSAVNSSYIVRARYSYATTSTFYLKPQAGKRLQVEAAIADISHDITMSDGLEYKVYAGVTCVSTTKYKRVSNILQESYGAHVVVPALGNGGSDMSGTNIDTFRTSNRGTKTQLQSIQFRYATIRDLNSALGLELRVKTSHDRPLGGETATVTFYCTSCDV